MRFHRPLDQILDSSVKVRILRFLCRKGGEWSGRRIAKELAMNPVTAHAALRELYRATVLDLRKVGNNFLYSLRDEHFLVREVLRPLFEQETKAHEWLLKRLRHALDPRLRSEIVTMALYGSLAQQREQPTSDIDLLFLVKSQRSKQKVQQALERLWETVTKEFGNPLSPYVNTVEEARRKFRRRLPLFRNILDHHQLIWGEPLERVLRAHAA